ncbi:MAG: hypothetical protein FWH57_12085 [Oscillospiraceae bacterium]|nr:hypothetical protein [Oscillospiraceae bacterium]
MEQFDAIKRLFTIKEAKGYSVEEVYKAKGLYGGIPYVLEQFYLQLGRSDELLCLQDELILPGRWPALINDTHLVFFNENPVYVGYEFTDWIKTSDTISGFLIAMFGYQAACWGLRYAFDGINILSKNDLGVIQQHFTKQPDSLENWWNLKIDLYASNPDERIAVLYLDDDQMQMLYAANNQLTFEAMQRVLKDVGTPL